MTRARVPGVLGPGITVGMMQPQLARSARRRGITNPKWVENCFGR